MARNPRNTNPAFLRHVSIRTLNSQLLLKPSVELNNLVGGIIAKYQQSFGIEIFAYKVLSNHVHLLLRAPLRNLWRFEHAINREIAKRVNRLIGRRGFFWSRRYDEQICPRREDAVEAMLYVTCNAVHHGLVDSPEKWPGLHSFEQTTRGGERLFPFTDYTAYMKAKKAAGKSGKVSIEDFQTWYPLVVTRLPGFEEWDDETYFTFIKDIISARVAILRNERRKSNKSFLGGDNVPRQSVWDYPKTTKRHPRPICFTKCLETKQRFRRWFRAWVEAYRGASRIFRSGKFDTKFPPDCHYPPLHCTA